MTEKIFALVDCNNFYVSCERLFDPSLMGVPIIVLSNDGCVIARSNEVKKLDIAIGVPFHQIKALCDLEKIKVFSSNFSFYGDMSARVMNCISSFTPNIEISSIDEAFLDITGFSKDDLNDYGTEIRQTVNRWTGIPVSVGIAPTKTLAKIANLFAKIHCQQNICNLFDPKLLEYVLKYTEISDIWGIGSQLLPLLKNIGVRTAWELSQISEEVIKEWFSVTERHIVDELKGISCLQIGDVNSRKSIISSRSFKKVITEKNDLEEAVSKYTASAAIRLRAQKTVASAIYIYIKTVLPVTGDVKKYPAKSDFGGCNQNRFSSKSLRDSGRKGFYPEISGELDPEFLMDNSSAAFQLQNMPEEMVHNGILIPFDVATNNTIALVKYAKEGLSQIYQKGSKYKKAGIMLVDLVDQEVFQHNLLSSTEDKKNKILKVMRSEFNRKKEQKSVVETSGITATKSSKLLSPRYTTNWKDLPLVL